METHEIIGAAIFAAVLLLFTAQTAFSFGRRLGQSHERTLANRRVRGVLDYENSRKPTSQKAKRKRARATRMTRVGSISLPSLEVRA